jgi:RNA polymerase sigma factor (sigma-70 family)
LIATAGTEAADADLVAAVRAGDDAAFEELYQRYYSRIAAFVCRTMRDEARCEDVAQEAFMSALRRMRATDAEINFKPWIFQIARNAAIDAYRRTSHAVEVSMDADDGLRASDRHRLVGLDGGPDSALVTKERLTHLQGAFDELSDVHTRVLVMRELEGMSYREIGQKLDLTRPAVESALFRARRRLESEYTELSEGRRCEAMRATIARMAAGTQRGAEEHRLARHAKRCPSCLRQAREQGVEPLTTLGALRQKAAALLPLPWLVRRSGEEGGGGILGLFSTGANAAPLAERAAALVAAAALVGAGGVALEGGALPGDREAAGEDRPVAEHSATVRGESQRGTAGPAADGERAGARRASGRTSSGQAGDRAGGSGEREALRSGESGSAPALSTPGSAANPSIPDAGSSPPSVNAPPVDAPSVPALPNGDSSEPPAAKLELTIPEVPQVLPETQLPPVEVPQVGLPGVQSVTGSLPNVLP